MGKIVKERKPIGYWDNYENCFEEALKYDCKKDFHNMSRKAYDSARRNDWLKDYTWFKRSVHCDDDYEIYAYEDRENKVVYVGLTYRLFGNGGNNRHNEHKRADDPVGKYFNGKIPMPRRLMQDLSQEDAQYYEDWYKKAYADNGWTLLNKAKTGVGSSSLGGVNIVWDYDSCFEESKKYEKAVLFYKENPSAYRVAATNGWIREWFTNVKAPNGYWTKERCREEAEKYTSKEAFSKNSKGAYVAASRQGLLDDYTWLISKKADSGYWTKDVCYASAKQCNTLFDFYTNYYYAYQKAYKEGWLDDYHWLDRAKKPNGYWDYSSCYEIAKECSTRSKFKYANPNAYQAARKNGWLDDWFSPNNRKPAGYWDYEHCCEEAGKYNTRKELQEGNKSVYNTCVKNKWLDEFFPKAA